MRVDKDAIDEYFDSSIFGRNLKENKNLEGWSLTLKFSKSPMDEENYYKTTDRILKKNKFSIPRGNFRKNFPH